MDSKVDQLRSQAQSLAVRFEQGGERKYIDQAVAHAREALELCPPGPSDRSMSLHNLALHLITRYKLGAVEDLEETIVLHREVLALRPPGNPDRFTPLSSLSRCHSIRYDHLGEIDNLNEAITIGRDVMALCPPDHSYHATSLNNLGAFLASRYYQIGEIDNLEEAIVLGQNTLGVRPPGHPDRWMSLNNLAKCHAARYNQLGATEDLNVAVVLAREALVLCQTGDRDRSHSLYNLGLLLLLRYNELREIDDINEAIVLSQDALTLCPPGSPDRWSPLYNLARCFFILYSQPGATENLINAILLVRGALALLPSSHPERSMLLDHLGVCLSTQYNELGEIEDLNEAIVVTRDAVALCPPGHLHRSWLLSNLASYLRTRFTRLSQLEDKDESFGLYTQIAHIPLVSSADLDAAREWIRAAEDFQHPTTLLAYETSLRLLTLHLVSLPSSPQHLHVLKELASSLAMDAFSACLRNRSPTSAVELLEQGRGVFWSQLTRLRSPIDDVKAFGPAGKKLADEFTQLTSLIRNVLNSPGADQHDRVCRLNIELQRVVTNIRELVPGHSRFLLPLLFSDLQQAANGGPVIIVNASQYSCDALIVFIDQDSIHIPLRITRADVRRWSSELHAWTVRAKLMDVRQYLAVILRQLWDKVVSPILDSLRLIHHLNRVFGGALLPSSLFFPSMLPVHIGMVNGGLLTSISHLTPPR